MTETLPLNTTEDCVDSSSRDGITIGLVEAILTLAMVLDQRLKAEARRMKRSTVEWEWFSDPVQNALTDLGGDKTLRGLLFPRDEVAMDLIRRGAEAMRARGIVK